MNELQFLTTDQIKGILNTIEKDKILPSINSKIDEIRKSDKYKENYTIIENLYIEITNLHEKLNKLKIGTYSSISNNKLEIDRKTLLSLNINSNYDIKNNILNDLKNRLQLITPSDFDTIITNMIQYINIDKYLYNKEIVPINDENNDEDYD